MAVVVLLFVAISKANPNPQKRKHYQTSSSYLDSYQFPDQQGGRQQRPPKPENPPRGQQQFGSNNNQQFGGFNSGNSRFGQRYPSSRDQNRGSNLNFGQTFQPDFGSGDSENDDDSDFFGTRFDFEGSEGSGSADVISDDEDFVEGSGETAELPEDNFGISTLRPMITTEPARIPIQTTTIKTPYIEEGSGDLIGGDVDDEDFNQELGSGEENLQQPPTIPEITIPTLNPTSTSTTDDFTIDDTSPPSTPSTLPSTTPSTTTKTTTSTTTTTTTRTPWRAPTTSSTTTTTSTTTRTTTTSTDSPITNPPTVSQTPKTTPESPFGPDRNPEKVPTPLVENRIVVIIIFITVVLCLVLGILFSLCMLCRYHKRPPSEASSDTASSDLPMLKADAKRYQAPGSNSSSHHIRRAGSESPPPLPDLNLFDEPVKFNRSNSGGSIRKSKRDLKKARESANESTYSNGNWKNPNWL